MDNTINNSIITEYDIDSTESSKYYYPKTTTNIIMTDSPFIDCDEKYHELRNEIIQLIHHKGYGVGNSTVAAMLRELGDYYDD